MEYKSSPELMRAVKAKMIQDNISMKDLAARMNICQQTLSSKFTRPNASYDSIKEIFDALDYSFDIIIESKKE